MTSPDLLPADLHPAPGALHDEVAAALVAETATVLSVPTIAKENSFILHAPLELMARVGLLPLVAPGRRTDALGRIESLRDQYRAMGDPVAVPPAVADADAPIPVVTETDDVPVVADEAVVAEPHFGVGRKPAG